MNRPDFNYFVKKVLCAETIFKKKEYLSDLNILVAILCFFPFCVNILFFPQHTVSKSYH